MGAYIEITAEGFPGIFPDFTFKGRYFIEGDRILSAGDVSTTIITDEEVQLVNDLNNSIRKVQVRMWRRYELHVFAHEATKINQWDKVKNLWIKVVDPGGNSITYKATVLNDIVGTRKRMGDTLKYDYTIEFIDTNLANYSGKQPVADFLESRSIFEGNDFGDFNSFAGLNYLEFTSGDVEIEEAFTSAWSEYYEPLGQDPATNIYRICTAIEPVLVIVHKKQEENTSGDMSDKMSRQVKYKAVKIILYVKDIDKNLIDLFLNYCHDGENKLTLFYSNKINFNIRSLERINPTIKKVKEGLGLWKVEIILPYKKIDFLPYK